MRRTDHWITQLKGTKIPPTHVAIDAEAEIVKSGSVFEHRFSLACARLVMRKEGHQSISVEPATFQSPEVLWGNISDLALTWGHVVVWAHNLAYDMRITDALAQLVERDWELDQISLVPQATWSAWKLGKAKLTLCDTMSWLPGPLSMVARDLGMKQVPVDFDKPNARDLEARCQMDTHITAEAVCCILDYLEREDLGHFRPTGSGQSHAALRRRFLPERSIRVHTDTRALAAEREAMHTGRCEAWRHGKIASHLYEFDMNLAYCRIAANHQVPGDLAGERGALSYDEFLRLEPDYAILAEVEVDTDEPTIPYATDDGIIWPTGFFRTMLWDPEIVLAYRASAVFRIRRAWLYRRTDALLKMCRWLVDEITAETPHCGALERRLLKHWARTVVGRMGLRFRSWEPFGFHPRPELCISLEPDDESGSVNQNMRVGRQMFQLAALTESYSSVPAIPGWVASRCRVLLYELIGCAGFDNVYYVDTDGLLVNASGRAKLKPWQGERPDMHLVYKGKHEDVTIHGPRNVELGDERRLSGVPRAAIRRDELTFQGDTWSGLEYALQARRTDVVEVSPKTWKVTPVDKRREHNDDGTTSPKKVG